MNALTVYRTLFAVAVVAATLCGTRHVARNGSGVVVIDGRKHRSMAWLMTVIGWQMIVIGVWASVFR